MTVPHPAYAPPPVLATLEDAANRQSLNATAKRLAELRNWLAEDLQGLERELSTVSGDETLAARAAHHLLSCPGKRIRPICVYLAARMGSVANATHLRGLAAAVELLHAATLLHDDVIDEGTERRGVPAARIVYGNTASVLGGDFLLVEALRRIQACGLPEVMSGALDVIGQMVQAEAIQLAHRGDFSPDQTRYEAIVMGKTASLFHWAMFAGSTLANMPPEACLELAAAGSDLGMAFQLIDDTLDLVGDADALGKDLCVDLREGKITWPILVACERDRGLQAAIQAMLDSKEGDGMAALVAQISATGAVEATRRHAREIADRAQSRIEGLPPSEARDALIAVVDSAIARTR